MFLSFLNKYKNRNTNAILKPKWQKQNKTKECISPQLLEFYNLVILKIIFQHQRAWVVFSEQWFHNKEKSFTISEAAEVKGVTASRRALQPERVLRCESGVMQKTDETELKEQDCEGPGPSFQAALQGWWMAAWQEVIIPHDERCVSASWTAAYGYLLEFRGITIPDLQPNGSAAFSNPDFWQL